MCYDTDGGLPYCRRCLYWDETVELVEVGE
jgi:hypothetical protein